VGKDSFSLGHRGRAQISKVDLSADKSKFYRFVCYLWPCSWLLTEHKVAGQKRLVFGRNMQAGG
jgi:hypothetical protein